jgi:quinol monooxygenase YgiN
LPRPWTEPRALVLYKSALVLYKRWSLRAGVDVRDVAALVQRETLPAYRRLSAEVTLGLEVALDDTSVMAIQRWSSRAAHEAVTSSDHYTAWWTGYGPLLARWDDLVEFDSEWSSLEVDLLP